MTHHKTIVLTNRDKHNVDEIMRCIERLKRAERCERPRHPTSTGVEDGFQPPRFPANSFLEKIPAI